MYVNRIFFCRYFDREMGDPKKECPKFFLRAEKVARKKGNPNAIVYF